MLRRLITLCVGLAVLAALAWALWPRPIAVETATIARRDITVSVEEEGKSRIREVFVVSAPIAGQMRRVGLHAGDTVVEGETVVARIEPVDPGLLDARSRAVAEAAVQAAAAAVQLAEAEQKQAQAQLAFLETEFDRAERLIRQGTISERAYEKARLDRDTAQAALDSAGAALAVRQREQESAEAALIETSAAGGRCCTEVKAPVSGRVLRVLTESEQVVQPGTPLVQIGNPADIEITADLLSNDAVRIKLGAAAMINGWGGAPLAAAVKRIDPSATTKVSALGIEEQRVPVILDLAPDQTSETQLGDGFRVVVSITLWEGKNLVAVPVGALFRDGADWAAYAVANGTARLKRLKLGAKNGSYAEVTDGLTEGDQVIVYPSEQVRDGVAVTSGTP